MSYDMQSFCAECGKHRRTMPFGSTDNFWDKEPCRKCGSTSYGRKLIAKWTLFGGWKDRQGRKVTLELLEAEGSRGY